MANTTNTTLPRILDSQFGGAATVSVATHYWALFTVAPTSSGGGTEVSTGSYARVAVTNNSTNYPNTSGNVKSNGTAIVWPTSTGAWGNIVAWGIYDASSAGNLLFWGNLTSSQNMNSGDAFQFAIGQWTATF